ncbi:MAG: uroporphyrinogen-III synthase, partial [Burkholderiaceae bacterium]
TQASPKAVGNFDGLLFFSPSGVTSFLQKNKLHDATCFAIGKTTAHALAPHTNSISIASEPTVSHLMALVKQHINS